MLPAYTDKQVFDKLVELGVIDKTKLKTIFDTAISTNADFGELLLAGDILTPENLSLVIEYITNIPRAPLSSIHISNQVLRTLPEKFASYNKVVCFRSSKGSIDIATPYTNNTEVIKMIEKKVHRPVNVYFALLRNVEGVLTLYNPDIKNVFQGLLADKKLDEIPIEKILNTILDYSYDSKASDIHFEPKDTEALVRYRVDGVLKDILRIPKHVHEQLINKVKVESKLRIDEHYSAQDGKMRYMTKTEEVDIRVSIIPLIKGENCVMRLLTSHVRQYGLHDLGLTDVNLEKVLRGLKKPYGMIVSTGPTGSGKTTSMYSILKELNTRERNITTIEDPVEYDIFGINQIQVNNKTNLTFSDGLRSILRQDPDVIYVGEIRDSETASISVNSAMTGHLVLTTLHTNNAATALPRLIDMKIEPFLVASTLNVIIAQRLVRKICSACKFSYLQKLSDLSRSINDQTIKNILQKSVSEKGEVRLYAGKGCDLCGNTGYSDRVGIFEILEISEGVRKLIIKKSDASVIEAQAIKEGMNTMLEDGISKALNGVTTLDEILRVTKE